MFQFFNPFDFLFSLEITKYLFSSLFVFGAFVLAKLIIFRKGL